MGVFFFPIFFPSLHCFCSPPTCNMNREKSHTSKYQLDFHPNWWQHEPSWRKKKKKGHLECFCSSFHILAVLLIGAWVCITICISKLDITVNCKELCSSTFNSNLTPYESTGLWTATEWHFEIRSWKCLTWKGELESLALWTFSFQSPTESTGGTIIGSLGGSLQRGSVVMRF